MKEDILAYLNPTSHAKSADVATSKPCSLGVQQSQVKIAPLTGVRPEDQVKKLTGMKKAMCKTMTESRTIPFFTFQDDINASEVMELRKLLKKSHPSLTLLPFFVKAASLAMQQYPVINSNFNPETDDEGYIKEYVIKKDHNFSIAIDSKDGLTVPNIKRVQEKSILQINKDIVDLRDRINSGKLTAADFEEATFSISSVGNIGGNGFVPTILRPQVAIMAIGRATKTALYVEDSSHKDGYRWDPAEMVNVSISADHRIIDGATVARFAARMKELLENPNLMLVSMS